MRSLTRCSGAILIQLSNGKERHFLTVCAYHCQDHLWQIPLFLHSLSSQYRFFLRPHGVEVWDLICYAVPVSRLNPEFQ
ncbi:MAG: hypothetical protein RLZZ143_1288 [Cyanobacteriota bacterium]